MLPVPRSGMGELGGGGLFIFPDNFAWIILPLGEGVFRRSEFSLRTRKQLTGGASGGASEGLF
jgi:hypothetical protein